MSKVLLAFMTSQRVDFGKKKRRSIFYFMETGASKSSKDGLNFKNVKKTGKFNDMGPLNSF